MFSKTKVSIFSTFSIARGARQEATATTTRTPHPKKPLEQTSFWIFLFYLVLECPPGLQGGIRYVINKTMFQAPGLPEGQVTASEF